MTATVSDVAQPLYGASPCFHPTLRYNPLFSQCLSKLAPRSASTMQSARVTISPIPAEYAVAPDGRFLMMRDTSQSEGATEVVVVRNWHQELLARVPVP